MNTRGSRHDGKRNGWQLAELSMVLGVFAIISVSATRVIIALLAVENRSGQALQDAEVMSRLGWQWRQDLHRAASVAVEDQVCRLGLLDGSAASYHIQDDELTRELVRPGQRLPVRETYAASARAWQFDRPDGGRIVALIREHAPLVVAGTANPASPVRRDRIEGAVGVLAPPSQASPQEGGAP